MTNSKAKQQTRIQVQLAAAICEEKKGEDTRILELDPIDSGLSDFFLITSASNTRQCIAIADEIELKLKREFGEYAHSVEGRRQGDWILLDYVDFVIHVFLAERRAFYDIERLRKSARPLTPAEFDAELKAELAGKTRDVRRKAPVEVKAKKAVVKKAGVRKAAAVKKAVPAKKTVPARKSKVVRKAVAVKKATSVKKAAAKKVTLKKVPAKKAAVKTPARKKAAKKR